MKRSIARLCIVFFIIFAFFVGNRLGYLAAALKKQSDEPNRYQVEELIKNEIREARYFFYKTMNEFYSGTYDPEDGYISQNAIDNLKEYKSKIESRCRLVSVRETYGVINCEVFYPSGANFHVILSKTDKGWILDTFNYLGNNQIWIDLSLYKDKHVGSNSNLNDGK